MCHYVTGLNRDYKVIFETPIPGRGHGVALRPGQRPGIGGIRPSARQFRTPLRYRFRCGETLAALLRRAAFLRTRSVLQGGRYLFSTENDFGRGRGVIGVWDAQQAYRRVKEWSSGGIGPHEISLSEDFRSLLVANGGVRTHPATGHQKLNIETMEPNLAIIDIGSGRVLESYRFDQPRHQLLYILHLAMGKSRDVCMALQDQDPTSDLQPLFALRRPHSPRLELLESPEPVTRRLQGFGGAVAIDQSGRIAAI